MPAVAVIMISGSRSRRYGARAQSVAVISSSTTPSTRAPVTVITLNTIDRSK